MRVDQDTPQSLHLKQLRAERARPPRYVYIDGELYWLASHAAEQMERAIALSAPQIIAEATQHVEEMVIKALEPIA